MGPGEVRVRIGAAAVNFPDVLLIAGDYQIQVPPPFIPGSELAGTVDEVAGDVTEVAVGDPVTGTTLVGAFAEEVVVAAGSLSLAPAGMSVLEAAAAGVGHRTAYHVLRSVARVASGDELIVLGAGGGVGLATVQLGAALGASVTAVASSPESSRSRRPMALGGSSSTAPPTCGTRCGRTSRREPTWWWTRWGARSRSRPCDRSAGAAGS